MLFIAFGMGLIGGVIGSFLVDILSRRLTPQLKSEKQTQIIGAMASRGSKRLEKRAPKANTDLKAFMREIQEEGENRV